MAKKTYPATPDHYSVARLATGPGFNLVMSWDRYRGLRGADRGPDYNCLTWGLEIKFTTLTVILVSGAILLDEVNRGVPLVDALLGEIISDLWGGGIALHEDAIERARVTVADLLAEREAGLHVMGEA